VVAKNGAFSKRYEKAHDQKTDFDTNFWSQSSKAFSFFDSWLACSKGSCDFRISGQPTWLRRATSHFLLGNGEAIEKAILKKTKQNFLLHPSHQTQTSFIPHLSCSKNPFSSSLTGGTAGGGSLGRFLGAPWAVSLAKHGSFPFVAASPVLFPGPRKTGIGNGESPSEGGLSRPESHSKLPTNLNLCD